MYNSQELQIQQAISEAKSGNRDAAKKILSEVIKENPKNTHAWYILSQVIEKPEQAIYCLEQVLTLRPDNLIAKQKLEALQKSQKPLKPKQSENLQSISEKTKNCPFCKKEIKTDALFCQYCGKDLSDISKLRNSTSERKTESSSSKYGESHLGHEQGTLSDSYQIASVSKPGKSLNKLEAELTLFTLIRIIIGIIAFIGFVALELIVIDTTNSLFNFFVGGIILVALVYALNYYPTKRSNEIKGTINARQEAINSKKVLSKPQVTVSNRTGTKDMGICPICLSKNYRVEKQGFSLGKAGIGAVLLGPVGLIGGFHGGEKLIHVCLDCGNRWNPIP
jgi:hypothetical protein